MIERRILDLVDAQDGIERATIALVRKFHAVDVVRNPTHLLGNRNDLILRDVDELRIRIDEAADQPGAGNSVDLWVFSRDPLARSWTNVATGGQSLLNPIGDTAFQKSRFLAHEAQCSGAALANGLSVNAVGDDLPA